MSSKSKPGPGPIDLEVVRLAPFEYIHVLDNNTSVTRVIEGPVTFTRSDNEQVVQGVRKHICIPPQHYCVIENPVLKDSETNEVILDRNGQVKVKLGDQEIRFEQEPFCLYPYEALGQGITPLRVLRPNTGLRLRAIQDFIDEKGMKRVAGDEWIFEGPGTYFPRIEVEIVSEVEAEIIRPLESIRYRAKQALVDKKRNRRAAGDEWLVSEPGAYLAGPDEELVERVRAVTLTETKGLHLEAIQNFTDTFGITRKAGERWLITRDHTTTFTSLPHERIIQEVNLTTLSPDQYCVVVDPYVNGKQKFGTKEIRKGPFNFFLQPGETLQGGMIQSVHILTKNEALLLEAIERFTEGNEEHQPGHRWMIYGPRDYIPPVAVKVVEQRSIICLDDNEGIYVRNTTTGVIRTVVGQVYMLQPDEELWQKDLPPTVLDLLSVQGGSRTAYMDKEKKSIQKVDQTKVITYNVPHNCVVQVYDFKRKKARLVFGPEQVRLEPDEQFTLLSLSGGKPKVPGTIKSLHMFLGPDFMTDIMTVETADHARLEIQLSYTWYFDVNSQDENESKAVFNVPDFVGDACRAISSRVRGAVAIEPFDAFHKNSSKIIKVAVFGAKSDGMPKEKLTFPSNRLVVSNVDVQSVEPVDQKTRDSLQKSVQLAIEITTKTQEAHARHEAEAREQRARGELERQIIQDKAATEKQRMRLLELTAENNAIETTGTSMAEAKAKAEAEVIEGETAVEEATIKANANQIEMEVELSQQAKNSEADLQFQSEMDGLEIEHAERLAKIETGKLKKQVEAIGRETLKAIAHAGPELQVKLLQALNLQGYMMTDGSTPINLFNAANSLTGLGGNGSGDGI